MGSLKKSNIVRWGMIGAGDVTEVKSGPAFKKVANSDLIAVMRRNPEKVKDYARRHHIDHYYTDAAELLTNEDLDAVYIATPPHMHLHYVRMALEAGKMVYVEKPVALNAKEACEMKKLVEHHHSKLVVAHYRRGNPYFLHLKQIIEDGHIGVPTLVNLKLYKQKLSDELLQEPKNQWRIDPAVSGGGLFHDLAPHQIDMMLFIFGQPIHYTGLSDTSGSVAPAKRVAGQILFSDNVLFNGIWDFDNPEVVDTCEIIGTAGRVEFSFFENRLFTLQKGDFFEEFVFEPLEHVQQPMIDRTVQYFRGDGSNPCSVEEAIASMEIMDAFTR